MDQHGRILDTALEGGCPTVDEELGFRELEMEALKYQMRLMALRGEPLTAQEEEKVDSVKWLRRLRELFPEVPERVLERLPPRSGWNHLPWNRRTRRRIQKAKEIVLHLFSGPDAKFWEKELETADRVVLCVDLELGEGQDVGKDNVMAYLMELCASGKVKMIIGGPPCRTVSRMRSLQPGPPPLRTRDGEERFGRKNLCQVLLDKVDGDTVLWMRMFLLYMVADEATVAKVGFLNESPQDPKSYVGGKDHGGGEGRERYPSYWAWV